MTEHNRQTIKAKKLCNQSINQSINQLLFASSLTATECTSVTSRHQLDHYQCVITINNGMNPVTHLVNTTSTYTKTPPRSFHYPPNDER